MTGRVEQLSDDVTLYLGDCREILPTLDRSHSIVTDNPYGMAFNTDSRRYTGGRQVVRRGEGRSDRLIAGDDAPFDPAPWLAFKEVILWGANHFAARLPVGATLVWLKKYPEHYATFLSDAEIGWQNSGHGVFCFHAPDSNGRRRQELTGDPFGQETGHPTQKPIALMLWCVERVGGGHIIDPFMGSGTTGVACVRLGRRFIGIEIEERYFDIACRRIGDELKRPRLDLGPAAPAPTQEALEL